MNWLNIYTPTLRASEFIGSEPTARATWLYVFAYCAEQENGGVIIGARGWKDRQWQQTCGVTLAEVEASSPLLKWRDQDLILHAYPMQKEAEVQRMRELGSLRTESKALAARENGKKGGRKPNGNPTEGNQENPTGTQRNGTQGTQREPIEGEEEGEGNRKEKKKGKEEEPPAPAAHKNAGYAIPECFAGVDGFTDALQGWIDSRKQLRKPATDHAVQLMLGKLSQQPGRAIAALNKCILSGWQGFEWTWMNGDRNNGAPLSPFDTQGGKRLMQ